MSDRALELFERYLDERAAGGIRTRPRSYTRPATRPRCWPA